MSSADVTREPRSGHRLWSFGVGRISGIEIRVHYTFFLLVPLFALAGSAPEGPGVAASLLWLVLIFACVVVHELAHCLVGRPRGAVVHEIVLLPIGGVSKLEHLPETPSDELAMAIAGPAASVGLAALAGAAALLAHDALLPIELFGGSLLAGLFWFNLIIAAFNLLPAFPLDGGRVFRALLERRYDLEHATRLAARIGRGVAVVLMLSGVLFDLWLVIIGVFVYFGASAEEVATIVHVRLGGQRVSDAMLLDPVTVAPTTDARRAPGTAPAECAARLPGGRRVRLRGLGRGSRLSSTARPSSVRSISLSAPRRELPPRTVWRTTSRSWRAPRRAHSR